MPGFMVSLWALSAVRTTWTVVAVGVAMFVCIMADFGMSLAPLMARVPFECILFPNLIFPNLNFIE